MVNKDLREHLRLRNIATEAAKCWNSAPLSFATGNRPREEIMDAVEALNIQDAQSVPRLSAAGGH